MLYRTTGKAIAEAIGVTPGRVSQLRREGMPDSSIEAAVAWYRRRVNPARSTGQKFSRRSRQASHDADGGCTVPDAPRSSAELARVFELAPLAVLALRAGTFGGLEAELRAALSAVPLHERALVSLDFDVWSALTAEFRRELDALVRADGGFGLAPDAPADDPDDVTWANHVVYAVAAGEAWITSPE